VPIRRTMMLESASSPMRTAQSTPSSTRSTWWSDDRMLHRTTRKLSLTTDGAAFYARCQNLLGEVVRGRASSKRYSERSQIE